MTRVTDVGHFPSATVIFLEGGGAIAIGTHSVYRYNDYPNDPNLDYYHDDFVETLDTELHALGARLVRGKYGRTLAWEVIPDATQS